MQKLLEQIRENDRLKYLIRDNKGMIIKVAAVILVIVAAFIVFTIKGDSQEIIEVKEEAAVEEAVEGEIFVDIGGAVKSPMLAELKEGSRVEDAIEAAGGICEDADLRNINRAAFVNDGDKIFIPSLVDEADIGQSSGETASSEGNMVGSYDDSMVNINTADSSQLQQLTGVGPVIADKIISYREENGSFSSIEDIKNVSGIGDKTYEKFKDDITT